MAMTFSTPVGRLIQTKVGLDDIIATYAAARAVYGWMGGMDGVKFLLSKFPNPFPRRLRELQLDRNLQLFPVQTCIITSEGLVPAHIDNAHESFGGDIRTQLIGSTICALAQECSPRIAVRLFAECLMPHFFGGPNSLTDALRDQLVEEVNLQVILNEGASRGLNHLFLSKISDLNLTVGKVVHRQSQLHQQDGNDEIVHESQMIGGMLKWIIQDQPSEYRTRSASVARVAACLQAIGYSIGQIEKWDGAGPSPRPLAAKSLVLVLGGSLPTDPLLLEPDATLYGPTVKHYQYKTVGSLLLTALGSFGTAFPEVYQSDFEKIFGYMNTHLDVTLEYSELTAPLNVRFEWKASNDSTSPIARRLAALYFPRCADYVAACYGSLDNAFTLDPITKNLDADFFDDVDIPEEVGYFRVITASIAISIASRIAPKGFETVRHSTNLELSDHLWLKGICKLIDQAQDGTLEVNKAIGVLAAFHAGLGPSNIEASDKSNIAWRQGIYSVLPSLLLNMDLNEDILELQCIDVFWANVKVRQDGSIRSDMVSSGLYKPLFVDNTTMADPSRTVQSLEQPWLGPPNSSAPDIALYLSIGPSFLFGAPDLCFVARIEGEVVGAVGVRAALGTLLQSRSKRGFSQKCSEHAASPSFQVLNVKASQWVRDRYIKPVSRFVHTYISVKDDPCWAIFLAGQTEFLQGRVVLGCLGCIVEESSPSRAILVGFR